MNHKNLLHENKLRLLIFQDADALADMDEGADITGIPSKDCLPFDFHFDTYTCVFQCNLFLFYRWMGSSRGICIFR